MAVVTYQLSTEHNNYPNFTVYDRFADGEPRGWRVVTNEGWVFYDPSEENTEPDPDTFEPIPVIYYYTEIYYPRNFNWDNFNLIAVPRDSVDENYIFGGGDEPEHEVM